MEHYLNNAGAAIMSAQTVSAIKSHLDLEIAIGGYQAAKDRATEVAGFYDLVADLIRAPTSDSIAFVDSASRAWNLALYGMPIQRGETIVTLSSEFGTNLVSLYHFASKVGAEVHVIRCDQGGRFDLADVEASLRHGARLVAISHVAAHGSMVNPVEAIGDMLTAYGALYIVDGCQSAGQMEIDVQRIGCHAYTGTGRKWLRGPRGTGFLYVRADAPISPLYVDLSSADLVFDGEGNPAGLDVRKDARRFELWERSVATLLGLQNALKEYQALDKHQAWSRMRKSSRVLRDSVASHPGLNLLGEVDSVSSIAGFYLNDPTREQALRDSFDSAGVMISTMSDWDCPMHFPKNGVKSIFRLAPHYYTSDQTVNLAAKVINEFPR